MYRFWAKKDHILDVVLHRKISLSAYDLVRKEREDSGFQTVRSTEQDKWK